MAESAQRKVDDERSANEHDAANDNAPSSNKTTDQRFRAAQKRPQAANDNQQMTSGQFKSAHNEEKRGTEPVTYQKLPIPASNDTTPQKREDEEKRDKKKKVATKTAGTGMQVAGAATQVAGKTINAAGTGMTRAGAALSSTGVGAIIGAPLVAIGGATKSGW